jgi:hypothetical protein
MERWPPWSPRVPTWVPTRGARRCPRAAALLVQINKEAGRRGGAGTPKATCRPTTGRPGQRARQTAHAVGVRCAAAALPRLVGLLAAAPRISRQLTTNTTSPLTLGCRNQKQGAPRALPLCVHGAQDPIECCPCPPGPDRPGPAGSKEGFQSGAEPNQRPAQHPHPGSGFPADEAIDCDLIDATRRHRRTGRRIGARESPHRTPPNAAKPASARACTARLLLLLHADDVDELAPSATCLSQQALRPPTGHARLSYPIACHFGWTRTRAGRPASHRRGTGLVQRPSAAGIFDYCTATHPVLVRAAALQQLVLPSTGDVRGAGAGHQLRSPPDQGTQCRSASTPYSLLLQQSCGTYTGGGGSWGLIFGAKRSRGHDGSAPCDLNPEPPALRGCAWSRPRATAPRRRLVSVAAAYFGANAPRDQAFLAPRNSRQAVEAGRRARRRGVKERDCGVVGILLLQCSAFPGGETGEQDHATTGRWPRHGGVVHADRDTGIHTPDLS